MLTSKEKLSFSTAIDKNFVCFNFTQITQINPISLRILPTSGVSSRTHCDESLFIFHHYLVDTNEFICILLPFSTIVHAFKNARATPHAPYNTAWRRRKKTNLFATKFIAMFWFDKYFTCLDFFCPRSLPNETWHFPTISQINMFSLTIYAMFPIQQYYVEWFMNFRMVQTQFTDEKMMKTKGKWTRFLFKERENRKRFVNFRNFPIFFLIYSWIFRNLFWIFWFFFSIFIEFSKLFCLQILFICFSLEENYRNFPMKYVESSPNSWTLIKSSKKLCKSHFNFGNVFQIILFNSFQESRRFQHSKPYFFKFMTFTILNFSLSLYLSLSLSCGARLRIQWTFPFFPFTVFSLWCFVAILLSECFYCFRRSQQCIFYDDDHYKIWFSSCSWVLQFHFAVWNMRYASMKEIVIP